MLWLRQGLLTATVVLMLGAVFVASTPFDDGSVRCGAPIAGAPTSVDSASEEVVALANCGDRGVTRLVYSTGLFVAALLAALTVLATWTLWSRPNPAAAPADPFPPAGVSVADGPDPGPIPAAAAPAPAVGPDPGQGPTSNSAPADGPDPVASAESSTTDGQVELAVDTAGTPAIAPDASDPQDQPVAGPQTGTTLA